MNSARAAPRPSITIGHAGLGYWGPNVARNFAEVADLRWLCDLSPDLLSAAAARHPGARTTSDFGELLADPELEAVSIATPVITHHALAKQALEAGKHVFVEKPQAQSSAEGEELVALAEERGLVLMPGYLLLYHPALEMLKDLIEDGDLGDVLYMYGNRQNLGKIREDENALWSIGAQDVSMILHLVGEEPTEAWARGESFLRPGIEDVVFCYLRFPSGVVAHMHLSWLDPHKMRKLTVVGRDKMAVFDDMEPERKVTVYDKGPVLRPVAEWQVREGDIHIPKLSREEPLRRECAHFVSLVRGEGDPLEPARQGLAVIRTLEQLQLSLETTAV
jgi:predicted dehydrogenase